MELLPLLEELCYKRSSATTLFSFNSNLQNSSTHELQIPNDSDAFVFFFSSTHNNVEVNEQFEEKNGQIEWKQGCCQWIYFLTKPESTSIKIEFNENCSNFVITDQ